MTLKVSSRFPGGNAVDIHIGQHDGIPEVRFASDPCGGVEALWFYLKIEETQPDPAKHTKIRLVWNFIENMNGVVDAPTCVPVSMGPGPTWSRLKQGDETRTPDGRRQLSWVIPHPAPWMEIAFCFPYGPSELSATLERAKDYWQSAPIGVSQNGQPITRVSNSVGTPGGSQPGIYIVARQHAGETPGSWVLDGLLRYWSQARKGGYVIWAVPIVDVDGVSWGHYGRDGFPYDLDRAWGSPPARHETALIQNDLIRWKARCRPVLALDLHAPGACERDGVYAYASAETSAATAPDETKWCNVIKTELQAEYAAPEFRRVDQRPHRLTTPSFTTHLRADLNIPALSIQIPYSHSGGTLLTQKHYREIGQRIGQALHRRGG